MALSFNTGDPMLGQNLTLTRPTTGPYTSWGAPSFTVQSGTVQSGEPKQRPFERFTSDLFGFTGGLLDTAGGVLDLFGGPPEQQPRAGRGQQRAPSGIDTTTALMIGGGLLVLVLVLRGKK